MKGLKVPMLGGSVSEHFRAIIRLLGEDVDRPGLRKTPHRVEQMFKHLTRGYSQNVDVVINDAIFHSECDEMVVLRDIDFYSLCEHHLLPFFGKCHIAYLPDGKIVGLSKLARIVEIFARRLQVQENFTAQIATTLLKKLDAKGVGVVVQAYHLCTMMRGVEKQNTLAVTSAMLGRFKSDPRTRQEFLELIKLRSPA